MTQKIIPIILGQSQHHTIAQLSPSIAQPILDISLSISSRDINIASLSSWFFIFFFPTELLRIPSTTDKTNITIIQANKSIIWVQIF